MDIVFTVLAVLAVIGAFGAFCAFCFRFPFLGMIWSLLLLLSE